MSSINKLKIITVLFLLIQTILWIDSIDLLLIILLTQSLLILTINKERTYLIILGLSFIVLIYATLSITLSTLSILKIIASYTFYTFTLIMNNLLKNEKQYIIDMSKIVPKMLSIISIVIISSMPLILVGSLIFSSQPSYIDTVILVILIVIVLALLTLQSK